MLVSALDRKLLRDLVELKGQVVTIALVVASGVAVFIGLRTTYESLLWSRDTYYERYRFADVYAHLERAPKSLRERIEQIRGVASVETRIMETVRCPLPGMTQPASGQIMSLPDDDRPHMLDLHMVRGRRPQPSASDEVVVLWHFARRHDIEPGDALPCVINGRLRELRVVGVALSPEFVHPIGIGSPLVPDDTRFIAMWMREHALAPTFQLEGAFNEVLIRLQAGAVAREVIGELDTLLERHGTFGAYGRELQPSNYVLTGELAQLSSFATWMPFIFLMVAAFLLNVVLSRLVYLQRAQIAALKAVGYTNLEVGIHFMKMVILLVTLGSTLGVLLGMWLGRSLLDVYSEFFVFPRQTYRLDTGVAATAILVSLAAGTFGALFAVRRAVGLPPAEAMRPASPLTYRRTLADRLGLDRSLPQTARMILRELERRPLRTLLSVAGLSMAVGTVMIGRFNADAINLFYIRFFEESWREDLAVAFARPVPLSTANTLRAIPGVLRVEGLRAVTVRMSKGHRSRDVPILGYPADTELRRVLDMKGVVTNLPADGAVLTTKLAELLGVAPGDRVEVELREGDRSRHTLMVSGLVEEMAGLQAHMHHDALSRLLGEEPKMTMALLRTDPSKEKAVTLALSDMPQVADTSSRLALLARFKAQSGSMVWVMALFATMFAGTIAVGVVYNNARIALSLRERELASLRVLGFTRREISSILLGELGIQVILSIPPGFYFGAAMCRAIAATVDPERFRFPVDISALTYAIAATFTLASGLVSALLVRRKLDHLDLIAVLKTRE